eukprot:3064031-Pyramimonas_sp.AAC.1
MVPWLVGVAFVSPPPRADGWLRPPALETLAVLVVRGGPSAWSANEGASDRPCSAPACTSGHPEVPCQVLRAKT